MRSRFDLCDAGMDRTVATKTSFGVESASGADSWGVGGSYGAIHF